MSCLALYLTAPLQSWGVGAKFNERPTLSFPSRSGILGLLAAACGVDRSDDAWLVRAAALKVAVRAYRCADRGSDGMRLTDYHTVGGGYDALDKKKQPWEYRMAVAKAEGGVKTELTHRDYLLDAAFGVLVSASDEVECLVQEMARHLENPVWGVWLGRKCCIPTEPVLVGVYSDEETAWSAVSARASCRGRMATMASVEVAPDDDAREDALMDVPISFARRTFATRTVAYPEA